MNNVFEPSYGVFVASLTNRIGQELYIYTKKKEEKKMLIIIIIIIKYNVADNIN